MVLNLLGNVARKTKAMTLAAIVGAASFIPSVNAQALLSFYGPQNVQVGVPTQYQLVIDTAHSVDSDIQSLPIQGIFTNITSNKSGFQINEIVTPEASNDVFQGYDSYFDLDQMFQEGLVGRISRDAGPSNVDNKYFATINATFNDPGEYVWHFNPNSVVYLASEGSQYPLDLGYGLSMSDINISVTAVPEAGAWAAWAGAAALGAAGWMKGRRKSK